MDRTTDPTPRPGRLQPDQPEPPDPPGPDTPEDAEPGDDGGSTPPSPSTPVAGPLVAQPPTEPPPAAPDRQPSGDRPGPEAPPAPRDGDASAGRSAGPPASVGDRQPPTPSAPSGSAGVPGREAEKSPPQDDRPWSTDPERASPGARAPRDASGRALAGCGNEGGAHLRAMGDRRASRRPRRTRSPSVDRRLRSKEARTGSPTPRPPRRPVAGPAPRPGVGRAPRSAGQQVKGVPGPPSPQVRAVPEPATNPGLKPDLQPNLNLRSRFARTEWRLHRRTQRDRRGDWTGRP